MKRWIALAVVLIALLVGLGVGLIWYGSGSDVSGDIPTPTVPSDLNASTISRCVQRFVNKPPEGALGEDDLRRYVQRAYCEPFARRGWVYPDGTFSIAAYTKSGNRHCETASPGGEGKTVPCPPEPMLDCAALNLVRRSEVQAYLERLATKTRTTLRCDDGTPLEDVGAT